MRPPFTRLALGLLAATVGCTIGCTGGDPSAPTGNGPDADFVAAALTRTADSLVQAGNVTAAIPFADAGMTLAALGGGAAVRVTEGGASTEYQAVAQRYVLAPALCIVPDSNAFALWALPVGCMLTQRPVLLLWRGNTPDEVIEISAPPGVSRVGESWLGLVAGGAPVRPTGSVLWERAGRRAWVATAGSVSIGEASAAAPCATMPKLPDRVTGSCAQGTQRAAFDLTYTRLDSIAGGTRTTRHLTLAATNIPLVEVSIVNPGLPFPPRPDSGAHPSVPPDPGRPTLPAPPIFPVPPLAGRVDARLEAGVVTLALSITNTTPDSIVVLFASGQDFDFQVRAGGVTLWTWSALVVFIAAPHSRTWAPFQSRTFAADWRGPGIPARPLVAVSTLTSSNRPLQLVAPVLVVP